MTINEEEKKKLQEQTSGYQATPYQESDAVKQAQAMLQQQISKKPGEYQSQWQSQMNGIVDQILNRDKFSYNVNEDALYNQLKDQYVQQGQMAMMDTMGQAQAMTGGYGNSYAQSVGQQAYQAHLQQLGDRIPDLYQMALNQYLMEGNALNDQFAILGTQEEQDYGRYQDQMSQYYNDLEQAYNRYDTERDYDYGQYIDDRNYEYQQGRDQVADEQWQKEYEESIRRFDFENKLGEFAPKETPKPAGQPYQPPKTEPEEPDYSDWGASEWESYFAQIRQSEGTAAAQQELKLMNSNGTIPKKYVAAASIGARGGQMGH